MFQHQAVLLQADDDTFVVSRNLDQLLEELAPEDPFLLGHRWTDDRRT